MEGHRTRYMKNPGKIRLPGPLNLSTYFRTIHSSVDILLHPYQSPLWSSTEERAVTNYPAQRISPSTRSGVAARRRFSESLRSLHQLQSPFHHHLTVSDEAVSAVKEHLVELRGKESVKFRLSMTAHVFRSRGLRSCNPLISGVSTPI